MADEHAQPTLPTGISRDAVDTALAALGLPKDDLRSLEITPRTVTARYLLREPTNQLTHGVVEVVLNVPIGGV